MIDVHAEAKLGHGHWPELIAQAPKMIPAKLAAGTTKQMIDAAKFAQIVWSRRQALTMTPTNPQTTTGNPYILSVQGTPLGTNRATKKK